MIQEAIGPWQMLIISAVIVFGTIFPIFALADVIYSTHKRKAKILWLLAIFLLNFIGALLYYLMGKKYDSITSPPVKAD